MPVVQELINAVKFKVDEASLRKSEGAVDDVKASMDQAIQTGKGVTTTLYRMTKAYASNADANIKLARNLGTTVEELTELQFAAGLSGVDADRLKDGLKDLQKTSVEAARGSKELRRDYRRLNINVSKFVKLPLADKLQQVADGLTRIENPAERAQVKMRVLGESGVYMGNLLDNGSKAIKDMRKEARDLGLVMSTETAVAAEKMNDAVDKATFVFKGLKGPISKELIPVFTEAADEATKFIRSLDRNEIKRIGKTIAVNLKDSFSLLIGTGKLLRDNLGLVKVALVFLGSGFILARLGKLAAFIKSIAALATVANLQFLLAAAALGLILLAAEDFYSFLQGKPSLIGDLIGNPKDIETYRNAFQIFFQEIVDLFTGKGKVPLKDWIANNIKESHALAVDKASGLFKPLTDALVEWTRQATFDEFVKNLTKDFETARTSVGKFFQFGQRETAELIRYMLRLWDGFFGRIKSGLNDTANQIGNITRLPSKAAKRVLGKLPGFGPGSSGERFLSTALGGGAANPAFDAMGNRAATINNSNATSSNNIEKVEININNDEGLTPKAIEDAATQGTMNALNSADLRRARRQVDGAMQ